MRNVLKTGVLLGLMLVSGVMAYGQQRFGESPRPFESSPVDEAREMKRPSLFKRPSQPTPEKQMDYARRLGEAKWGHKASMRAYRNLVHQWHEAPEAVEAQLKYACLLDEAGRYRKAFEEYQYLVDYFAGKFDYDYVLDRQFRIAHVLMTTKKAKFLFFPGFLDAMRALPYFRTIVKNAPEGKHAPQAQYYVGLILEQDGDHQEAVRAYEPIPHDYPDSPLAAEAAFRRAACLTIMATKRPRDERSIRGAIIALSRFLKQYPEYEDRAVAERHLSTLRLRLESIYYGRALYYEKTAKKPRAALIAYETFMRECPWSERIEQAAERIKALRVIVEADDEEQ